MQFWAIFCHDSSHSTLKLENPFPRRQTTLDFKNILTQVFFFYQNANLGKVTAKPEKIRVFWDTFTSDPHFTSLFSSVNAITKTSRYSKGVQAYISSNHIDETLQVISFHAVLLSSVNRST